MKFPKLLDGPNPVGEAKARHLETVDAPFLTAIGPGFVASKKGPTSEVTGVVEKKSVVEDGWFSFTQPTPPADVQVKATDSQKRKFRSRGTFDNPYNTSTLFPTGSGWAFALEAEIGVPIAGYATYSYSKSRNGRPSNNTLIQSVQLIDIYETKAEYSGIFNTFYQGQPVIMHAGAWFSTRTDGALRQEPKVSILFESSPSVWDEYPYDVSTLVADGESYTYAQTISLTPDTQLMWTAKFGDQRPTMYVTDDNSATWTTCPALPDIYPSRGTWTFDTRATIQADHPSWTLQQVEDAFVTQDGTIELAWDAHIYVKCIAKDRLLIDSRYLTAGTLVPRSAVSLVDPYAGTLLWQKTSTGATEKQYYESWPTAFGEWLVSRWDTTLTYFDEMYLLEDFGATETALTIPTNIVSMLAPCVNKQAAGPTNSDPPQLYFIVDESGERILYRTDDYFTTTKKQAVIGTAVNDFDFIQVIWVGSRMDRAPIDPTFPWRTDNRVSMPDWWTNVSAYGG